MHFFPSAHGTFSRIDHMSGHKKCLDKFKKIEIVSSKHLHWPQWYETSNQLQGKKPEKYTNTWKLNNMQLNNEWVDNEIKKEIKSYLETNKNWNTAQNLWDTTKTVLRGKFIACRPISRNQKKSQINNLTSLPHVRAEQNWLYWNSGFRLSASKWLDKHRSGWMWPQVPLP